MKQIRAFLKSIQLLGFLIILLGLAVLLNLLTLSSMYQINTDLAYMQHDIRWRLALGQVENAWLEQDLLLRRGLLDPANAPSDQAVEEAAQIWEAQVAALRGLTDDQETIDYLVSLPSIARGAFTQAVGQQDPTSRQASLNQAFSTNQAIDFLLEDQAFTATSNLRSDQALLNNLVAKYNGIGLIGLTLFGLVGIWVLFWASRLPQPLLAIRMALAAASSGNYRTEALGKVMARRDAFGELAQAVHQAAEHLQTEEQVLQAEVEALRQQVGTLRRSRLSHETVIEEVENGSISQ